MGFISFKYARKCTQAGGIKYYGKITRFFF